MTERDWESMYEGIVGRLDAILGKMPAVPQPEPVPFTTHHLDGSKTVTFSPAGPARQADFGAVNALHKLLTVLDGWIEGARDNHDAGHRHEDRGEECWRTFAPSDIRNMVNDAARELGIGEFPKPTTPREDTVR